MPPLAASKSPRRAVCAPVKAPLAWPNSSDSSSSEGSAAQLIATKGFDLRSLLAWSARASTSLPEPLSPRITTDASVWATVAALANSSRIGLLSATMRLHLRPRPAAPAAAGRPCTASRRSRRGWRRCRGGTSMAMF